MPIFGFVIPMYRDENVCRFLHFVDSTSKGTSEGPQELFKIYHITPEIQNFTPWFHPNKTFQLLNHFVEVSLSLHAIPHTKIITVKNKNVFKVHELTFGNLRPFIVEKRLFWNHSFQKT
jgi:hypothetical protein